MRLLSHLRFRTRLALVMFLTMGCASAALTYFHFQHRRQIMAYVAAETSYLVSISQLTHTQIPPTATRDQVLNTYMERMKEAGFSSVALASPSGEVVKSTNPGQVLAWLNVTNTGQLPLQSLRANQTLPLDWRTGPHGIPSKGAVHVFFRFTNGTMTDITGQTKISVSTGNPQTVSLTISNIKSTAAGKNLAPGESILLSVKMSYGLIGTSQSARSYPRNYTDTSGVAGWTAPSFTGSQATGSTSGFFLAYAKVVG